MASYVLLVYFITLDSFWTFAAIHLVLVALTVIVILAGGVGKVLNSIIVALVVLGASTALGLTVYYLIILSNLANG